jgi:ribosomal protein L11 methyltransferase
MRGAIMQWLQIGVAVTAELAEAVADVLGRFAPGGVAIEVHAKGGVGADTTVGVNAYVPVDSDTARIREKVEEALWHLGQISPIPPPEFSIVEEQDWADAWKEHFHPLRIGQRIVIKPTWREFKTVPDDIIIELDPGMAFGTGLHPTTQMCLLGLEEQVRQGMKVLDLGTGSGILAVAAAKLGATVFAVDTDPVAVEAALENVQRNHVVEQVVVAQGSLERTNDTYDLVVVNILAHVIVALAQKGLADCVKLGGRWIAAGIIEPQVEEVEEALRANGLLVTAQKQMDDRVTLIGQRSTED